MPLSWRYINDGLSCTFMGTPWNTSAQQWNHLHFVGSSLRLAIMANVGHQILGTGGNRWQSREPNGPKMTLVPDVTRTLVIATPYMIERVQYSHYRFMICPKL